MNSIDIRQLQIAVLLLPGTFFCLQFLGILPVWAQITVADPATESQVIQQGERFVIQGGILDQQGTNLFHQFSQFNLSAGQVADFQAGPQVENVFGQIVGGQRSVINGLLQLTGAQANLYLINPAGILFGSDARLNLPASFTATTANRIGFGDGWLDLQDTPDYTWLSGTPQLFEFSDTRTGAVVNQGDLAVQKGQTLSLTGDAVVNTGSLAAPEGQLTVASVDGGLLRISQTGYVLSLEGQSEAELTAVQLPTWLTGGAADHASSLMLNANGEVILGNADNLLMPAAGETVVSGSMDVSGGQGGVVQVLGNSVALIQATIEASGQIAGGKVHIGGDFQGQGTIPRAALTAVDRQSVIQANAVDYGDGGDVILWSDGVTQFLGDISARGGGQGGNGGFVEVSGKHWLGFEGSVDLRSQLGQIGTLLLDPQNIVIRDGTGTGLNDAALPQILNLDAPGATFTISETALETQAINTNIILQATDNITIEDLSDGVLNFAGTGTITFNADSDSDGIGAFTFLDTNDILQAPGRALTISAASITTGDIQTNVFTPGNNASAGGSVTLLTNLSPGNGNITTGNIDTSSSAGQNNAGLGGAVTLLTSTGNVTTGNIKTASTAGLNNALNGGAVSINTLVGNVSTGNIQAFSEATNNNAGQGGNVALSTANGSILAGAIESFARAANNMMTSNGGAVSLAATNSISTQYINTQSDQVGGSINVITSQQFIANGSFLASNAVLSSLSSIGGNGSGSITIQTGSTPFQLGGTPSNGTVAAITTGGSTLTIPQTLTTTTIQGDLQILGLGAPPPPSPLPPDPPPAIPSSNSNLPDNQSGNTVRSSSNSSTDFEATSLDNSQSFMPSQAGQTTETIELIQSLEKSFSQQFEKRLRLPAGRSRALSVSFEEMQSTLRQVEARSQQKAALVYLSLSSDQLEIVLVTGRGMPVHISSPGVTRQALQQLVATFHQSITNPVLTPAQYLPPAQALYQQLIVPIKPALDQNQIQTIAFVLDEGLRSLPLAALHDGEHFLVESYSIGLLPTYTLTDFSQVAQNHFQGLSVLGMGIETFQNQFELFAVPLELDLVTQGKGQAFLNDAFTRANLEQQLSRQPRDVVHLATHAVFRSGAQSNSYIQLWDQRLTLDQMSQLPLAGTALMVLSACTTALGDRDAEYGFAGLAVNAGAQTALASLWAVSDEGTLGFMTEFYRQLEHTPLRVNALRQAQLAMLRGELWMADGMLYGPDDEPLAFIPELARSGQWDFKHPAYWSAFTMVGNPW